MQREIKFKACDKETNRMFDVQLLQFFGKENNLDACWTNGVDFDGETTLEKGPNLNNLENLILLQYTGLKDQNDVDVFEGDILKFRNIFDDQGYFKKAVVMFVDGAFECNYSLLKMYTKNTFEVIGNIYENPELLEVK